MTEAALLPRTEVPPGEPGRIALLADGLDAFASRVAAARGAQHTLDLQYYIWQGDLTGRLLAREALKAADRGVRVRILMDDMFALNRTYGLTALNGHPMVQMRRFNATRWRRWGRWGLLLEIAFGNWHLNRRMHNKAWIADGRVVICGGRNIGNRYFDASDDFNFRDLDVVAESHAAADAAAVFEAFWASPLSQPIEALRIRSGPRRLRRLRRRLERLSVTREAKIFLDAPDRAGRRMLDIDPDAIEILADPPDKAAGLAGSAVAPVLEELFAAARREVLLISPYFVPGQAAATQLMGLVGAGVRVAVITNSLAATDVIAVHGGYARYRARLIAAGVEVYELKHSAEGSAGVFGSRGASLHTKAVVVDGRAVFVGSFNLDPRSANLNTEMGVLTRQPALARLARRHFARLATGARSWRVRLAGRRLVWDDGTSAADAGSEPGATRFRRAVALLVRVLPVESQL
ncbi:phospholipase D family protein [Humitalea sp. 24SJ18S-53]|uniref:phospholipase D family protein n=1 Tax=Humitalea sp. 24SJ18S-53 TaxID=3422307 RepID=UPI003D673A84